MLKRSDKRRADSVVEIIMNIAMCIAALFLVLRLFGANIESLVENSTLHKMLTGENNRSTAPETWNRRQYNENRSDINVQTVGEQGLTRFLSDAQVTIDQYLSQTPPLTNSERVNLALAFTIKSVLKCWGFDATFTGQENKLAEDNGINSGNPEDIWRTDSLTLVFTYNPVYWNTSGASVGDYANQNEAAKTDFLYSIEANFAGARVKPTQ